MSTPDRKFDRFSSRRNNHLPYESPFRRARLNNDSEPDIDGSRIPSPSPKYGTRQRRNFGQTRTLRGAYEAASRTTTTMADSGERPAPPLRSVGRTPSPRSRRQRNMSGSARSPVSDVSSPPGELLETYRRINDADNLIGLVEQDEYDLHQEQLRADRLRHVSPRHTMRDTHSRDSDHLDEDLSFLDELTDDSLRAKLANHIRDEQRLKRVTAKESPVFSKAKVGIKATLSAEHLQRRETQPQEEIDDGLDPSLNLPSWGSQRRTHRDWLSTLNRRNTDAVKEESHVEEPVVQGWEPEIDFTARSLQVSDSPPMRRPPETRVETERGTDRRSPRTLREDAQKKTSPDKKQSSLGGSPIPNSPVVVYKDSNQKPVMAKSDSQELLRKLARAESPPQNTPQTSTPESKPVDKWMLAKTPVVTGAWVDTPMTERVAEPVVAPPEDITEDITSPSKVTSKADTKFDNPSREPKKQESGRQEINKQEVRTQELAKKDSEKKPEPKEAAKKPEEKKVKRKLELIKPHLPKSALETVLEDARSKDHPLTLGDDTINSLQDILDQDSTFIKGEDDSATDDRADLVVSEDVKPLPGTDAFVLDNLNLKLRSLVQSIHEARQGLSSLEDQVAKDTTILSTGQVGHLRHGAYGTCDACGGHVYLPISLPRLWRRDAISHRIRPTRLGWFALILLTWYWSECIMCDYYCHPFVAETCDRNCLTPDAPRFPFVLPTMLWRWSHLSTILTPVLTILIACFRLIAQLLGFWDGYWDESVSSSLQPWSFNRFGFGHTGIQGRSLRDIPVVTKVAPDGQRVQSTRAANSPPIWQGQAQINTNRNPPSEWDNVGLSMDNDEDL